MKLILVIGGTWKGARFKLHELELEHEAEIKKSFSDGFLTIDNTRYLIMYGGTAESAYSLRGLRPDGVILAHGRIHPDVLEIIDHIMRRIDAKSILRQESKER